MAAARSASRPRRRQLQALRGRAGAQHGKAVLVHLSPPEVTARRRTSSVICSPASMRAISSTRASAPSGSVPLMAPDSVAVLAIRIWLSPFAATCGECMTTSVWVVRPSRANSPTAAATAPPTRNRPRRRSVSARRHRLRARPSAPAGSAPTRRRGDAVDWAGLHSAVGAGLESSLLRATPSILFGRQVGDRGTEAPSSSVAAVPLSRRHPAPWRPARLAATTAATCW